MVGYRLPVGTPGRNTVVAMALFYPYGHCLQQKYNRKREADPFFLVFDESE